MLNLRKGPRRPQRLVGLVSVGAVATALLAGVPTATAAGTVSGEKKDVPALVGTPGRFTDGRYIVVMKDPAVSGYAGGTKGYAATKAGPGATFRDDSSAAQRYSSLLRRTHDSIADEVGAEVERSYTVATNGFAAELSAEQALDLATDRRVLAVEKDEQRSPDTWNTPDFLGLSGKNGAWAKTGGQAKAGDGIVVADLDTGIWPESKSFTGQRLSNKPKTKWDITIKGTSTRMEKADGDVFTGECELGERWAKSMCSTKIIGARYYPETFLATTPEAEISPHEFISTRDGGGHGSHTAGTAAGNATGNVKVEGRKFGKISGMAPAARLAVYKVCWEDTDPDTGGCYNSAILAAIDDAVSDGADVLNFSISGATDTVVDPVELAFEGAAEAGVFVSASAGNSGPGESTVAHNSPWLTTVAATTHARLENTVVLGNGKKLVGASVVDKPLKNTPLVAAEDIPAAGVTPADAALCGPSTLDATKAAGKMVLCLRGVHARTDKSAEVKRAGGVAMILGNVTESSLDAEFHAVPTVHVSHLDTPKVQKYIDADGPAKAKIELGNITKKVTPLPQVGGFSSRGPAIANDGDLLKPDISAPGVSVLAAVAPPSNHQRKFDLYSGTSMSAPHIAGLAAFILGERPNWEPMAVKSAMMTTATSVKNAAGRTSRDWFGQGAGQVRPKKFLNPGLFVTSDGDDWRGFITGQGLDTGVPALAAKDLNVPSIAQSAVTGTTKFTRTFRASSPGRWKISANVPGFRVKASKPAVFSDRKNDLNEITFTFTRTDAPLSSYAQGWIKLIGPTTVRMPVALQPVAVAAPDLVEGEGVTGAVDVPITAGFTGSLDVTPEGLTQAVVTENDVPEGDANVECVTVDDGTDLARFELDSIDDTADLDMYVYAATTCDPATAYAVVGEAATGSADEVFSVADLPAGTYLVEVDGFAAGSAGSPIEYALNYYGVGAQPGEGDLTVTPDPVPVTSNKKTSFELSWTGLDPASRYFGQLTYDGSDEPTYVSVVTP